MGGAMFSGSTARKQEIARQVETDKELAKQKELADAEQASSLQDSLNRDTKRLLRVFSARSLMAGGGVTAPVSGV